MGSTVGANKDQSNVRICILSTGTLQTRVLADFLGQELNADCVIQDRIDTCINVATLNPTPTLLLLDCSHVSPAVVVDHLQSGTAIPGKVIPAFFNLKADSSTERSAVQLGVRGFFYVDDKAETLVKGIRVLLSGEAWISRRVLLDAALHAGENSAPKPKGREQLTAREVEILAMICVGARNEEIAQKLFISTNTVKTHIYNIYKKISVPNRTQAALWAAKHL
jgi:DNA-binding NarL/FixJ family response regulator